ncbi:MAG TPA: response regulator [Thermoanaerobaculia bacterium]|nr:response regulator [Thermoanaerobaculia bacterium]
MAAHSVLIVEDDPAIRRLVKMVLQREGYEIDVACDGVEAVLKLGLKQYDVIILDLMMPHLDGFSFMSTLAENDPQRLKSIIVTSAASPQVIHERMKGAPFDVLPKPFDIQQLVERVKSCIAAQRTA